MLPTPVLDVAHWGPSLQAVAVHHAAPRLPLPAAAAIHPVHVALLMP